MPPHLARPAPLRVLAAATLLLVPAMAAATLARAAPAASAPASLASALAPAALAPERTADDEAALTAARDRAARSDAAVAALKQALKPGHFADPLPDLDRPLGLDTLRDDYADMQRRAAGYRATLGDQHPTLVAAEQVMAGLRTQLTAGLAKALASAERDGAEARAATGDIARRIAARPAAAAARLAAADRADVTGAITATPHPRLSSPAALPRPQEAEAPATTAEARDAEPRSSLHALGAQLLGLGAGVLAVLLAAWAVFHLLAGRRRAAEPAQRRVEPALDAPATQPTAVLHPAPPEATHTASPASVPVLAHLALPARATPAASASAADLHDTLRLALGDTDRRMTVLVAAVAGLETGAADAAGVALALAAAAAGRRPLVMEARPSGHLRAGFAPAGAVPLLVAAGGTVRTLYRLDVGDATIALLPSDAGEAEVAATSALRPGTRHLQGLDAFDTVILLGDAGEALARGADIVLLTAPAGTSAADLAAAARPLQASGRSCGAVLVDRALEPSIAASHPAPRRSAAPRGIEPEADDRLGLRGTFAEDRRRRTG